MEEKKLLITSDENGYMLAPATYEVTTIEDFVFDDLLECAYEELYNDDDSCEQDARLKLLINYEDLSEDVQNKFIAQFKSNKELHSLLDVLEYMDKNINKLYKDYYNL